jgi:hypothetical protein
MTLLHRLSRWPGHPRRAGLLLAALQGGLLLALATVLRIENATQPRGWARTVALDPNLPIRGRYVTFVLQVPVEGMSGAPGVSTRVELRVREGRVIASPARQAGDNPQTAWLQKGPAGASAQLDKPLAFFLPEHSADPSRRPPGETLWAEVTLPRQGPPRPLRLGVERPSGPITPLPSP